MATDISGRASSRLPQLPSVCRVVDYDGLLEHLPGGLVPPERLRVAPAEAVVLHLVLAVQAALTRLPVVHPFDK